MTTKHLFVTAVMAVLSMPVFSQTFSLKNNLLYDATLTPNIGMELKIGRRSTVQLFYGLHPWRLSDTKYLRHWSLMPEYRYWLKEPFRGHFFGVHALGGEFNIAGFRHHRYEGWYVGGGLTYGYAWHLSTHWNLEAAIGLGYVHAAYDKYENEVCGDFLGRIHRNVVVPTKLALNIAYVLGKKKNAPMVAPVMITPPAETTAVVRQAPVYHFNFVTPKAETEKARNLSGRAYLDFVVNTTDIRPDYRRNAEELAKVRQTIDAVRQDPNTSITHISIHGYASPEGSYANNTRLAQGRAQAFKDYVQMLMTLPAEIFSVESTPEDWEGLMENVKMIKFKNAKIEESVFSIVKDESLAPDQKEQKLKREMAKEWKWMVDSIFPALRHSDYEVSYTIRPFTVEEASQLIKTKPQQLSLNEMFLVAQTYEPGSPDFNEVFEVAVRMYPEDETANLNAAVIALRRDDQQAAARYLAKAGKSAEAINLRGVLAAKKGDMKAAADYFRQAPSLKEAQQNLEEITK